MIANILYIVISVWTLLLLLRAIRDLRVHGLRARSLSKALFITLAIWIGGIAIFLGVIRFTWGYLIPHLENQGEAYKGQEVVWSKIWPPQENPSTITTPTSTSTSIPTGPQPTPSSGDQLVRDYRVNGITRCLLTADSGDEGGANIIALADTLGVSCIAIAGDVIYPNGSMDNFLNTVKPYMDPWIQKEAVFVVPGNHDWWRGYPDDTSLSWTADELPLCQAFPYLPQGQGKCRYYRVVLSPDVEVFFFDSDFREPHGNTASSIQGNWLQAALTSSTAKWKIVVTHEPPVSSCNHEPSAAVRNLPLLSWGVDILVTGHCHQYERSNVDGLPAFVVGVGGESRYQFERPNPFSLFRYRDGQGALIMSASANQMKLEFVTTNGQTLDSLTLNK